MKSKIEIDIRHHTTRTKSESGTIARDLYQNKNTQTNRTNNPSIKDNVTLLIKLRIIDIS